jgi:hypothetical protein
VGLDELNKMGVALKRARYFIYHRELPPGLRMLYPEMLTLRLLAESKTPLQQLSLFDTNLEKAAVRLWRLADAMTLLYDGSFDGFLTAVFEAFRLHLPVSRIACEERYETSLFDEEPHRDYDG